MAIERVALRCGVIARLDTNDVGSCYFDKYKLVYQILVSFLLKRIINLLIKLNLAKQNQP